MSFFKSWKTIKEIWWDIDSRTRHYDGQQQSGSRAEASTGSVRQSKHIDLYNNPYPPAIGQGSGLYYPTGSNPRGCSLNTRDVRKAHSSVSGVIFNLFIYLARLSLFDNHRQAGRATGEK